MNKELIWGLLVTVLLHFGCGRFEDPGENGYFMHIYGSDSADVGTALVETQDHGFALTGSAWNPGRNADMVLILTDEDGHLRGERFFGGPLEDRAQDILLMPDGGFLLVGFRSDGDHGGKDVWIVRTDKNGDSLWSKTYGGSRDDYGQAACLTQDGGFIVVGSTGSNLFPGSRPSDLYPDMYMLRLDAFGNTVWQKTYVGPKKDVANNVAKTQDGGFVVVGSADSDSLRYGAVVLRLNPLGDTVWTYTTHSASNTNAYKSTKGFAVIAMNDQSTTWLGTATLLNQDDIIMGRLDINGHVVPNSTQIFGGNDNEATVAKNFDTLPNGEFIIPASSMSGGNGGNDFHLFQANATKADPVWNRYYGGSNEDIATSMIKTSDGMFAVIGYSKSFSFNSYDDIVLLKTNAEGELLPQQ